MGSKAGKQKNSHKSLTDDQMNLLVKTTKFDSKEINEWHNGFIVLNFIFGCNMEFFNKSLSI